MDPSLWYGVSIAELKTILQLRRSTLTLDWYTVFLFKAKCVYILPIPVISNRIVDFDLLSAVVHTGVHCFEST